MHAPISPSGKRYILGRKLKGRRKRKAAATLEIKAPMVGTFFRAPSPEAPPYAEVGDVIAAGQVVCIIEAMKLMNEIKSEIRGKS